MVTPGGSSRRGRRGQPGRPSAGLSASGEICVVPESRPARHSLGGRVGEQRAATMMESCSWRPHPRRSPTARGSTSSATARARPCTSGKARSLRARLSNYFADPATLAERTAQLVRAATSVDWTVTASEVDALLLENSLIKTDQPRLQHPAEGRQELPVPRGRPARGVAAARRRARPARAVASGTSGPSATPSPCAARSTCCCRRSPCGPAATRSTSATSASGGPACSPTSAGAAAPCVGWVDHATYEEHVQGILRFFSGDAAALTRDLSARMRAAAADAGLRGRRAAPRRARPRRARVGHPADPPLGPRRPRRGGRRERRAAGLRRAPRAAAGPRRRAASR